MSIFKPCTIRWPARVRTDSSGWPLIRQGTENGFELSWNPDDDLWYVHAGEESDTVARFQGDPKGWNNALQWCRKRNAAEYPKRPYYAR